jgi:hypothetical protein
MDKTNHVRPEGSVTEVVEAQGHLIDSHIMERIFDTVVEFQGKFEVERFTIGRTNSDPSHLRLKLEAPGHKQMEQLLEALVDIGCSPVDSGDVDLRTIDRDKCAPEDFYSTTNHRTYVRVGGNFVEVQDQRMDALVVVRDGQAWCRKLRDIKAGDQVVVGMRGIRVVPESKERDRLAFAFMSNGISSERQVETAVHQTAGLIQAAREAGQKVIVVAGPVVVHTGGAAIWPSSSARATCKRCSAATRSACTISKRRSAEPRSGFDWRTGGRKSTGTATTCERSTRSTTAAISRALSSAAG